MDLIYYPKISFTIKLPDTENTFNPRDAKRSLESYLENVLQTFVDTTGICIEEIKISTIINPATNKRTIKEVSAVEDTQVVAAAFS